LTLDRPLLYDEGPVTRALPLFLAVLTLAVGRAADAEPELNAHDIHDIQELSLDDLLNPEVKIATGTELHAAQTPAIVTVISADEIQARGYASLAEILRAVPGFYDVYDGVTHNVGIRGINGGQDASGNVLKLMIDGQPVDYRPTTGNFFGEELIPIDVIERVEVIRGPASALYGANAFLGVINVVTKSGEAIQGAHVVGQGALVREHPGGGGGAVLGGKSGPVDVIVGGNYNYLDRSGLGLPSTSPLLPNAALSARAPSRNDIAQRAGLFAKLTLKDVVYGTLSFLASLQYVDAHGEYQSFGPLTHDTRLTTLNQHYRLSYEVTPVERVSLTLSANYFNSAPTSASRYDIGRSDYVLLPSVGADGFGFNVEGRVHAHRMLQLTVGGDFVQENHTLETYDQLLIKPVLSPDGSVLRAAGTIIPGAAHGAHSTFRNVGAYVQGMLTPRPEWTAIGGLRIDDHNIYGANLSARAGVVWARRALSLKLLYGSSFKAASAEQLYAQPIGFGGIQGNPQLQAQTAHTIEGAGSYQLPRERGRISVNVFATDIIGRVEFLPFGNFVQAQNIQDEWVMGSELDSRIVLAKPLHLQVLASVARTLTRSTGELLLGKPEVTNPLFPEFQLHVIGDYFLPWWGLKLSAEVSYIGPRSASFSNALLKGASYDLPGYAYTALSLSTAGRRIIPKRDTSIALRISNVINYGWIEPGFGGIDVPAQGITAFLTVVQAL
jgi:outer membrane receptor protein involved in Fe transport